jgi:hypothetical protein
MDHQGIKNPMKLATIIFLLIIFSTEVNCQESINTIKPKNSITVDGATAVYLGMFGLNYERTIVLKDHLRLILTSGFGGWYLLPLPKQYSGFSIPMSFNFVEGSGNNHFEADLGLRYTFYSKESDKDKSPCFPVINFGYRYQRPDGTGLIFRSFIGYSGIGIGVGKAF